MTETDKNSLFAEPRVTATEAEDRTVRLGSPYPLGETARCIGDWLVQWAGKRPDTVFIAERSNGDWRRLTYGEFHAKIRAIAGWLLKSGANERHPVAILSENAIDHALLTHAAMYAGIPVATVSTAYSLMSKDHEKLNAMIRLLDPGIVYVSDLHAYEGPLKTIASSHRARILASRMPAGNPFDAVPFSDVADTDNLPAVDEAFSAITPDTVARLLFTSGSTGVPKAVINTHRMLTANQEANGIIWPFLKEKPPVLVDWLPWSHTFGANFTFNLVLRNGGTLHVDEGKPAPALIGRTIANIKDVRPTMHFNVPRGYDMLVSELESDAEFRETFFGADLIFYAAAALPESVWNRLIALSNSTTGRTVPLVAAWGSTETAPLATSCYFQAERSGNIGLPVPGTELKLVPNGDKLEVRVRGPNVTPGYYKQEEATRKAFDEEGFYMMGDAVRLADPQDPAKGLYFDGRVSEDFKLSSGTWVSVGDVRISGIDALSPVAQDIVVAGHDHDEIGFLVFPNEAACRKLASASQEVPLPQVLASEAVRNHVVRGLQSMKARGGGSSRYATRARLLADPPDPDSGEITDKGYLNQRRVLSNRGSDVDKLQGNDPSQYIQIAS